MPIGLVGRKIGMTRQFTEEGYSVPVTVIEITPNRVAQIKTIEKDGYCSYQVTIGTKKPSRVKKPIAGHFAKAGVDLGESLWEFPLAEKESQGIDLGSELKVDSFKEGQMIDVTGISRGKGFAGAVKRHNFRTQDMSHGNSLSHRAPGSIGQNQSPGRVFKGKKMAGHLGNTRCTMQNQEIIRIDVERNLLLVKGAVPGAPGSIVHVRPSVKKAKGGEQWS
jgi:large subunit ribosomal protein L3